MKKYYVFIAPEKGEPYRFVTGVRRRWLVWRRVVYSHLPVKIEVEDYDQLRGLINAAEKDTGRGVKVCLADKMDEYCSDNLYWAVVEPGEQVMYYTGKRFSNDGRYKSADGKKPERVPEVSADIRECQLFVRKVYAEEARESLNRKGFAAAVVTVYVNVENVFVQPCIAIVCVNKRFDTVHYVRDYGEYFLQRTDKLSEAKLIYPEQMDEVYEQLSVNNKELSFTFIVRPNTDIPASRLREHEKELVQRIAVDFYIGKK